MDIVIYVVEEDRNQNPILNSSKVFEFSSQQEKFFLLSNLLFGKSKISVSDPRVSQDPKKAVKTYIARKRRIIRDLIEKKKLMVIQINKAKLFLKSEELKGKNK